MRIGHWSDPARALAEIKRLLYNEAAALGRPQP
jgi:hypothetical protein